MLSVWKVTRAVFGATSKLLGVQLRGDGQTGDDANAAPEDDAPVLSQLGVAVRPLMRVAGVAVETLHALCYEDDEVWVLKLWDKARSPIDLDEGETRLFSAGDIARRIRLLVDRINVEAPRINLGAAATKKVNRQGDPIEPGTLAVTTAPNPSGAGVQVTLTYTPPVGLPQTSVFVIAGAVTGSGGGPLTLGGRTGVGSSKVFAED